MKLKILTVLILCLSFFCKAQQTEFAKIYFDTGYYAVFNFIQLSDSSYVLCGKKGDTPSSSPYQFLLHLNSKGDTIKSNTFFHAYFSDLISLNDSMITVMATNWNIQPGVSLVNINMNNWDSSGYRNYTSQGFTGGLIRSPDNGYLLSNISAGNYAVMKLDSIFNLQWHSSTSFSSHGQLLIDSLNNILVTCEIQNAALQPYAYSYYDPLGGLLWGRSYGDNQGQYSGRYINGTVITTDSNFLAFTNGYDWQLMKINRLNGDTMWTKQFGGQIFAGVSISQNRHYVFTTWGGVTTKWLIDDEGAVFSSEPLPFFITPIQAHKTLDGGFALCGTWGTGPPQYTQLPALIKFDSLGNTVSTSIFNPDNNFAPLSFYPNPARDEIFINAGSMAAEKNVVFTLSDMQGRTVLQQPYENNGAIDIRVIPAGLYIATLRGKEKELRGKVMVEK